jgi:hypothetical protein
VLDEHRILSRRSDEVGPVQTITVGPVQTNVLKKASAVVNCKTITVSMLVVDVIALKAEASNAPSSAPWRPKPKPRHRIPFRHLASAFDPNRYQIGPVKIATLCTPEHHLVSAEDQIPARILLWIESKTGAVEEPGSRHPDQSGRRRIDLQTLDRRGRVRGKLLSLLKLPT